MYSLPLFLSCFDGCCCVVVVAEIENYRIVFSGFSELRDFMIWGTKELGIYGCFGRKL